MPDSEKAPRTSIARAFERASRAGSPSQVGPNSTRQVRGRATDRPAPAGAPPFGLPVQHSTTASRAAGARPTADNSTPPSGWWISDARRLPSTLPSWGTPAAVDVPRTWASSGHRFQPKGFEAAADDRELLLGIDFGTSCTKAVVRDDSRGVGHAVRFSTGGGVESYLVPATVYRDGSGWNLCGLGRPFDNLKLPLLATVAPSVEQLHAVVAYLALVARAARALFFERFGKAFGTSRIVWGIHIGIPARFMVDPDIGARYRHVLLAAWLTSGASEIAIDDAVVGRSIELARALISGDRTTSGEVPQEAAPFGPEQLVDSVKVFPEVMAELFGFLQSDQWDRRISPFVMLVDIGAGTLDVTVTEVSRARSGELVFLVRAALVEGLGTANLLRSRLSWAARSVAARCEGWETLQRFLETVRAVPLGRTRIPDKVEDCFPGVVFQRGPEAAGKQLSAWVDEAFDRDVAACLWSRTALAVARTVPTARAGEFKPMPVFPAGGGCRHALYEGVLRRFTVDGRRVRFELRELSRPADLFGFEGPERSYDRLAVAYGLASSPERLGRFQLSAAVPRDGPPDRAGDTSNWADRFVAKEST